MATIVTLIPDVELLCAMPQEEVAFVLLQLINEHKQHRGEIHPGFINTMLDGDAHLGGSRYPQERREEARMALAEAWNWLSVQGLLIGTAEPASNGWMQLSRKAKTLLDQKKFADYSKGVAFPRSLLHPSIADDVWLDLSRGDLDIAVLRAFKQVEIAVRAAGGFGADSYGVPMMRDAFKTNVGPLADKTALPSEQDAMASMFAGAIGAYKNPQSHRAVGVSELRAAQHQVALASHLLDIVDSRKP